MSGSPYVHLTVSQIWDLHDAVLEEHGGATGLLGGGLDICAAAPQNVAYLQEGDVFEQASACASSILQQSPLADGNRGTALAAALVFLRSMVSSSITTNESMPLQAMLYLAEGKMDGNLFAQFLREAVSGLTGTWEDESQDR